jgi:hypothetical protein
MMRSSLESFKKLRALSPDDPEWVKLRDQLFEENLGLAYHAVERAAKRLLNIFSGGMWEQARNDLLQIACQELARVIAAYDPARPNPLNPEKHVEFATFALSNLLPKVKAHCKKLEDEHNITDSLMGPDDEDDDESLLDNVPGPPSPEELDRLRRELRADYISRARDPGLVTRLVDILDKLWGGDSVTLFERQLLFRLIADPAIVLTRHERAAAGYFGALEIYEPLPLRRYRLWRQMID